MSVLTTPRYHVELYNGAEHEKPVPKNLHSFVQSWLIARLLALLPEGFWAYSELNVRTGTFAPDGRPEYVVPDITLVHRGADFASGDLAAPPIWAVEIRSPGQTFSELVERGTRLHHLGCPLVWLVFPERQQAWHFDLDTIPEVSDSHVVGTLPDGQQISIECSQLWSDMHRVVGDGR